MIITASNSKGFKKINCIDDTKIKSLMKKIIGVKV
jgi:hypothetical protein